jgi:hypothetical protein
MAPKPKVKASHKRFKKKKTTTTKSKVSKQKAATFKEFSNAINAENAKAQRERLTRKVDNGKIVQYETQEGPLFVIHANPKPEFTDVTYQFMCGHCFKLIKNFHSLPKHVSEKNPNQCFHWQKVGEEMESRKKNMPASKKKKKTPVPEFLNADMNDDEEEDDVEDEEEDDKDERRA